MLEFRLLFLPFLAFQHVIKVMGLIEIFELSQTSRHTFAKIKFAKKKILPLKLEISNDFYQIRICDYMGKEVEETNFELNFTFKSKYATVIRTINLNGIGIGISRKNEKHVVFPGFFSPLSDDYLIVANYLRDLFSCPDIFLGIHNKSISTELLRNPIFSECHSVSIRGAVMEPEQLSKVFEHSRPKHTLYCSCFLISYRIDLKQTSIFDMAHLYLTDASRVSLNDLLNMKCELCIFGKHKLTQDDIKQFIRRWSEGTNPQLFRLRINKFETEVIWENMLEGLNYMKWDGKRRPRYFRTDTLYSIFKKDFANALDFKGGNSRLASVMQTDKHFEFVVWPQ